MRSDAKYLAKRQELADSLHMKDLWSIVDQFGLYAGIQTLGTRLAVYEILKLTLSVPGHIAEFGCWRGGNLLFMAKVLQLLQPNTYKHLYGFDSFEGLKTFSSQDGASAKQFTGQYKGNEETLRKLIDFFDMDEWVHIVKGDALKTIPAFEKANSHLMFSLAYIDFDLYKPCKLALNFLKHRISPGGIIVFDEALTHGWPGEGKILVEFLADEGVGSYKMRNISFARQPTAFLIKQ
jgi:hypothetical protein